MMRGVSRRLRRQSPEEELLPTEEAYDSAELQPFLVEEPDEAIEDRRPHRAMHTEVRPRVLLFILLLVVALALVALDIPAQIPAELLARWPWLLVIVGVLWLLVGLVTAWPHGTLGGPLVAAVGVTVLLEQQGVLSGPMTLGGVLLVTAGLAVTVRGLTMPRV